jgi:uncharacterized protein
MNATRTLLFTAFLAPLTLIAGQSKSLNALLISGGGYHDYAQQIPLLTSNLNHQVQVRFDVVFGLEPLTNALFAKGYDIVVYDICLEDADPIALENMMRTLRDGKPAVMIHCAVHSFKKSAKVRDWENSVGMRSRVHDPYQPFQAEKVVPPNPILKEFPENWRTAGDELYQTIEMTEDSQPLLKVKSPQDGRVHIVCWTHMCGQGRVFATTLGHDLKTIQNPDYTLLLSRGLLWACGQLPDEP